MGFRGNSKAPKASSSTGMHAARLETSIGPNTSVVGTLKTDGDVRVDGSFEGDIEVLGNVIVGVTGRVIAGIKATNIHVAGAVRGDLFAEDQLQISETGRVWGDITARGLQIEPGGVFRGQSDMTEANELLLLEAPPERR